MDAKPHRPLRPFKVRDENAIASVLPAAKTIHSRNKSSPALSTLASQQAGPFRTGFRRTAFADVSNTSRVYQVAKDDSAVATTKAPLVTLNKLQGQENEKAVALAKPAQRPLSVSGIGRFLQNFTSNAPVAISKQPTVATISDVQPDPLPTRARSKKSTAVLRDVVEQDPLHAQQNVDQCISNSEQGNQEPHPVHIDSSSSKPTDQLPQTNELQAHVHALPPLPQHPPPSTLIDVQPEDIRSNATSLSRDQSGSHLNVVLTNQETYVDAASHVAQPEPRRPLQTHAQQVLPVQIPTHQQHVSSLDPLLELDEHILKESYTDQYDEDGYTTARSLRSRGDYTTSNTTIVLAPRVTERSERELYAARQLMLESRATDEIEEDESWDTSMVAEYGDEIFAYMHKLAERMTPNPYYMDHQSDIQWSMRSVLMDWLIQVHHRFQLLPETLFLCVNYIDRFLSCKVVSINKLQLVGATALLVAAKYEEIQCPTVHEISYMVEGSYQVDEILKAERFMLTMLQFELGWPGPMSFLRRVSKADDYDLETRTLAKYFLEVTIMDERFVATTPSFTAAGAHCLARLMLRKGSWSPAHVYYSEYTYSQLRPLLVILLSCCDDPVKHHRAVWEKYRDKRYKRASDFVQNELDLGFMLPSSTESSPRYLPVDPQTNELRQKADLVFV